MSSAEKAKTAAVIVLSVLIFILSFASASAWILTAQQRILGQPKWKAFIIMAGTLTALTLGGALAFGFGFGTTSSSVRIPLDASSLLDNLNVGLGQLETKKDGPVSMLAVPTPVPSTAFII